MNIALRSGYVSWTELIVNCRSLNRFFRTFISYNGWTNYQTTGIDLYYEKGKKRQCTKCFRTRTVRIDPFCWVHGNLCSSCMPETIPKTRALMLLRKIKGKKNRQMYLSRLNRIHKKSPYGKRMTLYLSMDVFVLLETYSHTHR